MTARQLAGVSPCGGALRRNRHPPAHREAHADRYQAIISVVRSRALSVQFAAGTPACFSRRRSLTHCLEEAAMHHHRTSPRASVSDTRVW